MPREASTAEDLAHSLDMPRREPIPSLCPDLNDDSGLICAFRLSPLSSLGREALTEARDTPLWLHFNVSDSRARRWLRSQADIPAAAHEALLGSHTRVHVQKLDQVQGFVAVLGDLNHDFDSDPDGFGELRLFVTPTRIVSTRRHPLRTVDQLRRVLSDGVSVPEGSPLGLFQRLIEASAETFGGVTEKLGERVDDAEDRILAGSYQKPGRALGAIRRLLVRLRRLLIANRSALLRAPERLLPVDDTEHRRGLREALDRLDAVSQDLDLVLERARLLEEEIARRLSETTNRSLFVLSIVTTALLPITLITGVFGMNMGGLPWLENPRGFERVLWLMGGTVTLALVLLNRSRLLKH